MKKKIEADLMYHVYEAEKAKKRADKEKHLSEANLKIAVNIVAFWNLLSAWLKIGFFGI